MPIFYMMVGLPGSGKTYFANKILGAAVHSSDAIRAEILGDENDQSNQALVFETLHNRVYEDLKTGKNVVYDATNLNYKRRREFLKSLSKLNIPVSKICVFMATPYEICLRNNAQRDRVVPEDVINRMYKQIDVPMMLEGWDDIFIEGVEHLDLVPAFEQLVKLEHDNPHHSLTVGQHLISAWNYSYSKNPILSRALQRAIFLHDIGKRSTKVFHDSKGNPSEVAHFYSHEKTGAYDSFSYTCDLDDNEQLLVALYIRWHMMPYAIERSENPAKTREKFIKLVGQQVYDDIMLLNECDLAAH